MLALLILFAAITFGEMMAFLILGITAANTTNADVLQTCYNSVHILAETSVRASAIGTLVMGILLSIGLLLKNSQRSLQSLLSSELFV